MSNRPISTFLGIAAAVVLAANSSGFGVNPCPEDTNGDGVVNVLDLIELLLCFGLPDTPPCDTGQDIDGSGTVNVLDLIDLLLAFGTACRCDPPDCDDGDPCTVDTCVNGVCENVSILVGVDYQGQQDAHLANPQCVTLAGASALEDCLVTPDGGGTTFATFSPAIPADFFAPGSDPVGGAVVLVGNPAAPGIPGCPGADTVIERSASPFVPCDPPGGPSVTVDIEIVELSLVSVNPITVTFNGGQNPEEWDVAVDLSAVAAPLGTLTATKAHCNGGTFSSCLNVQAKYTFTKVVGGDVLTLDTGLEGINPVTLQTAATPWIHGVLIGIPTLDFIPGLQDPNPTLLGCADNDGDGFSEICDCDDFNLNVNPGVDESAAAGNCNDGIDNDCDGLTDAADPDCP